jgi:4-hydroxy-4-methyl-2-oxoglutarate aldolase
VGRAAPDRRAGADGDRRAPRYWGVVLATAAQVRGVAGLVIDGGVRDTEALARTGFPVFSSGVAIRGTAKKDRGTIGEPVRLGGVEVRRGDLVIGDADGVVELASDRVDAVLAAAWARARAEQEYQERIRGGELTMDIYQLREAGLASAS